MPQFTIQTDLGETISFEADQQPTEQDLDNVIEVYRRRESKNHQPREFSSPLSMTDDEINDFLSRRIFDL